MTPEDPGLKSMLETLPPEAGPPRPMPIYPWPPGRRLRTEVVGRLTITGIDIPIGDLIGLWIKVLVAAVPAAIIVMLFIALWRIGCAAVTGGIR